MENNDARALDHKTLEALRVRAVSNVQAGEETPSAVARALGVTARTMYGERRWSFLQAPEGGRAGRKRKRGWLALYRRGGFNALKAKPLSGRPPRPNIRDEETLDSKKPCFVKKICFIDRR